MKRYLLTLLTLFSFWGASAQLSFTVGPVGRITTTVTDTIYHDSAYCQSKCTYKYQVTIDPSAVGDYVMVVDSLMGTLIGTHVNTTGASPWTFIQTLNPVTKQDFYWASTPGTTVDLSFHATKIIITTDTMHITPRDSIVVNDPCEYEHVSGSIYIDNNSNCIHDAGEAYLTSYSLAAIEHLSSPVGVLNIQSAGGTSTSYTFPIQRSWMTDYTITLPPYYPFIFPSPACYVGSLTYTTLPMTGIDFPLLCTHNIDVQCAPLGPGRIRPFMPFSLHPYVSNTGCDTAGGVLTLVKDHRAIYDASLSTPPADAVYGDTLVWHYYGLSNVSSSGYWNSFISSLHLTPDATVAIGDTLCFRVYTGVLPTDINAANNDETICVPVVYSYDPNIKEVSPCGEGPEGNIAPSDDTLTYTLHFQNTGTAAAYDVRIIDTLDADVNPASLRILGASHKMEPRWLASNVVQFTFDYIMLPDSATDEPRSHGAVKFSVALDSGLPVGTQIKNKGYIYFDYNPPVITNTTLNTIALPAAVHNTATAKPVHIYPNPATDKIFIESTTSGEVWVLAMNGTVVTTQKMTAGKTTLDISALPPGVYMIRTVNDANTAMTRITKY